MWCVGLMGSYWSHGYCEPGGCPWRDSEAINGNVPPFWIADSNISAKEPVSHNPFQKNARLCSLRLYYSSQKDHSRFSLL